MSGATTSTRSSSSSRCRSPTTPSLTVLGVVGLRHLLDEDDLVEVVAPDILDHPLGVGKGIRHGMLPKDASLPCGHWRAVRPSRLRSGCQQERRPECPLGPASGAGRYPRS